MPYKSKSLKLSTFTLVGYIICIFLFIYKSNYSPLFWRGVGVEASYFINFSTTTATPSSSLLSVT